jgi:hypothetical protein
VVAYDRHHRRRSKRTDVGKIFGGISTGKRGEEKSLI